jgi:hypothetical protein
MNSGTLDIRITSPTTLQMVSQTGGFSATKGMAKGKIMTGG